MLITSGDKSISLSFIGLILGPSIAGLLLFFGAPSALETDAGHFSGAWVTLALLALMSTWCSHTGKPITWEQALNSKAEAKPDRYDFDADPPTKPGPDGNYPIAVPGVTKFY